MVTQTAAPVSAVAPRGSVQKTFVPATILSGFTDGAHFEGLVGEYLATQDAAARAQIVASADQARAHVANLQPLQAGQVVLRPITGAHVNGIAADPVFIQTFGARPYGFAYVDLRYLVALQPWIEPRVDPIPTTEQELLDFALPTTWDVAAELSFIPPVGPIQILASNPAFQGVEMKLDAATGVVTLGPPKHLNLVQVMHFGGRYFLRNGYHRVTDTIAAGAVELPAIVSEAAQLQDVQLPGSSCFNINYVAGLERPPLVADFHTPAATKCKIRERRYGVTVSVDVRPINIGI